MFSNVHGMIKYLDNPKKQWENYNRIREFPTPSLFCSYRGLACVFGTPSHSSSSHDVIIIILISLVLSQSPFHHILHTPLAKQLLNHRFLTLKCPYRSFFFLSLCGQHQALTLYM